MTDEFGAIDVVCNFEFADPEIVRPQWSKDFVTEKLGGSAENIASFTAEQFIEKMDEANVDHVFLIAVKAGSSSHRIHRTVSYEKVAAMVDQHPTRFSGLAGIDPTEGMKGVRELERAVNDLGFIGAHLYPHWFEMAPDHAKYYPFYAKCVELNVPIQMQVGHCLRYSEERPLRSVGRPITLDTVACDFPELKLVGIHLGWPWTEEMIAVAYKHPNVYIGSDAYAPEYWPESFIHFVDSWGSKKVLFGTDFPLMELDRARKGVERLAIRGSSRKRLMRNNAIELYGLDLPLADEQPDDSDGQGRAGRDEAKT